jgi:rhodanese-related sulfurtransferase
MPRTSLLFVITAVAAVRLPWPATQRITARSCVPLAAVPDKADDAFELVDADDFDDLSDDDVEDLLFQFDRAGKAKPSALAPHLQAMVDGLKAGTAVLVDVRPVAEWNNGHLPFAVHRALQDLRREAEVPDADAEQRVYLHAGFGSEAEAAEAASLLQAAGRESATALTEGYEALRARFLPQY